MNIHMCPSCGDTHLARRGKKYNKTKNITYQQYSCKSCKDRFSVELPIIDSSVKKKYAKHKRYVFTSAQNDTSINEDFFSNLLYYCQHNDAEFHILKSTYNADKFDEVDYGIAADYILDENVDIGNNVRVYAALNILATAEYPLSGVDSLSQGKTLIIGHPNLQMKTLPVFGDDHPIMITTTGTVSNVNYGDSKTGIKAEMNHTNSAIVLEVDSENDIFHIRVLHADSTNGFCDLDKYYTNGTHIENNTIEAIVLGDTHVTSMDSSVYSAVFGSPDSIVNTLKPKQIVHHDLLDFGVAQSHHNSKKMLSRFELFVNGKDDIKKELDSTVSFLNKNTPNFVEKNIIVASNHNEHLESWLNNAETKYDYKNLRLYHFLMYKTLTAIEESREINPFQFYFEEFCDSIVEHKTKFLEREELYFIKDILVSSHGDKGNGGARFTPIQGKKLPYKMIVGHSHSPSITGRCYCVGTMTGKMDYTKGSPSAWMNTVCIIHHSGERQLVSVIKGRWRG